MLMGSSWIGLSIFLFLATNRYVIVQFLLSRLTCTCTFYRKNWVNNYFFEHERTTKMPRTAWFLKIETMFALFLLIWWPRTLAKQNLTRLLNFSLHSISSHSKCSCRKKSQTNDQTTSKIKHSTFCDKNNTPSALISYQAIHTSQITR